MTPAVLLAAIMAIATVTGLVVGRTSAGRWEHLQEPFGVLQGALSGFMGLGLAFHLSLAVGALHRRDDPGHPTQDEAIAESGRYQSRLWALAGQAP